MKTRFLLLLLSLLTWGLGAQIINPVSWDTEIEAQGNNEYLLKIVAQMDDNWAVYSQFTPEGGPLPTVIDWETGSHYEAIGATTEAGHRKEGMDDMFGVEVIKFLSDEPLVFTQKVKVNDFNTPIQVMLEFMCCDDEQCLPPTEEFFSFSPVPASPASGAVEDKSISSQPAVETVVKQQETNEVANPKSAQPTAVTASTETDIPTEEVAFAGRVIHFSEPANTEADPVQWQITATETAVNTFLLEMMATVEPEWTLYSMELNEDVGPVPNQFLVEEAGLTLKGELEEDALKKKVVYEDVWGADVPKIYEGVTYRQTVEVAPDTKTIAGTISYMACKEVCLPPEDLPWSVDLPKLAARIGYDDDPITGSVNLDHTLSGSCQADFDNDPLANCSEGVTKVAGKSMASIFGLGFLGGLFALIMPCIFPMIPLTVNFFNKGGKDRVQGVKNAGLYGFFIFAIYILLSSPFHLIEGVSANILNDIASNVGLNIFFFLVFMFFAGSFFGYYELVLPTSWTNRSSKAEGSGGIIGIFFMALTLALVSFSCTGPILGSLLVGTASEGAWPLTAGMAGFGLALALPFTLFAAFPQLLQSLPSSGGWLNSVKVVLGFVEVALAFKFLSNADLVGKWDTLKIEPFYIIWILCCLGITAY
ncbi:MAG: cytochrome c biogenesis protein CcdA, partial [Bacteroidota bacterium]